MKVKLNRVIASDSGVYQPGEHDLPADFARALCAAGAAEALEPAAEPKPIEVAEARPPESADLRKRRRR